MHYIPQDDQERKDAPMFRGLMGYFPAALFEVAAHSLDSDRKHNPGSTTGPNWARGKSSDHEDCIMRHLIDAGPRRSLLSKLPLWLLEKIPGSSARDAKRYHLRCLAWRALALLQEDCEACGAADGVSCVRPAVVTPEAALEHPALTLARDAALAEECRGEWIRYGEGARARVQVIKLARVRLGIGLSEARDWVNRNLPETKGPAK